MSSSLTPEQAVEQPLRDQVELKRKSNSSRLVWEAHERKE